MKRKTIATEFRKFKPEGGRPIKYIFDREAIENPFGFKKKKGRL